MGRLGVVVGVPLLALVVAATAGTASAGVLGGAGPLHSSPALYPQYSNGVVVLSFPHGNPSFLLSSATDGRVAGSVDLKGIAEVNTSGGIVAFAPFNTTVGGWSFSEFPGPSVTQVQVAGLVPVVASSGAWQDDPPTDDGPLGNVSVQVTYSLNASSGPTPGTASFTLRLSGWPWQNASDHLGLALRMTAVGSTTLAADPAGDAVLERALLEGTTVARFHWAPNATAYSGSSSANSTVSTYRNVTANTSSVRLLFAAVSGGYDSLEYDPWLTLNLGAFVKTTVAWLVTPEGLLAMAAGGVLVATLAGVAARKRREPSPDP